MDFNISKKKNSGILLKDEELICIKDENSNLLVYNNNNEFNQLATIRLSERTNQIGKYWDGVYYFQDKKTIFFSFEKGQENIIEGKFYYGFYPNYKAFTSFEKRGKIIFELDEPIEIDTLQKGGRKLFLDQGLIQAQQIGNGTGVIVYNSLSNNGNEIWRHSYSDLTSSDKANLHSRIFSSDDKLFFVVTGNERKGLFVLDIETGEVKKKYEGLCYEIFKDGEYIYTTQFENILCKINVKTLEIERWDCNTLVTESGFHSIHDHRCDVVNGRFCFTQTLGDDKAKLGVLDWQKKKLVYKHEFEPKNGAIGSIQVNKTRMFVHTQDNILHIFEQE
ncbi:hypothetical protein [Croceivirga radicis]|uniref:hypothetical protein n=1 Tax=Croceivirga radicis TaxID=1929488 RepID=UPI000255AC17|nr:hypothetical protein [Croceivirga radicis]